MCLPWPELCSCQKMMFYILGEIARYTMSQVRTYPLKRPAIKLMTMIEIILHINHSVITNVMQIHFSVSHQITVNLF